MPIWTWSTGAPGDAAVVPTTFKTAPSGLKTVPTHPHSAFSDPLLWHFHHHFDSFHTKVFVYVGHVHGGLVYCSGPVFLRCWWPISRPQERRRGGEWDNTFLQLQVSPLGEGFRYGAQVTLRAFYRGVCSLILKQARPCTILCSILHGVSAWNIYEYTLLLLQE